jgi:hypothetical protein
MLHDERKMLSAVATERLKLGRIGVEAQRRYLEAHPDYSADTLFSRDGAVAFPLPERVVQALSGYFSASNEIAFDIADGAPGYDATPFAEDIVRRLNEQNIYYGKPSEAVVSALKTYLAGMHDALSHQFKVVNLRAWQSRPGADMGPSAWHCDGDRDFFLVKLMLYMQPPNIENGTIEFFTRGGRRYLLAARQPMAILLDSSLLLHRGRPSLTQPRPIIEITIAPTLQADPEIEFAGQNARFPSAYVDLLERALS